MEVYLHSRVHHRVLTSIEVFGHLCFPMSSHDHLVSVGVDMALAERYRLGQDVVARANQVNEEHFVVLDKTEDTFVVVACALRAEGYNDPLRGMRLDNTFTHRK